MSTPPLVLSIAGSDSGGGAGLQADLKTLLALGVHAMSVVTAVTAQNSVGVQGSWELPTEAVRAQFTSVVDDIGVAAVKTGMLGSAAMVATVAELLGDLSPQIPVVVDPVAVSKHGDALLAEQAVQTLREQLLPRAYVLTPNLPEVELLTGIAVRTSADQLNAAGALLELGPKWVLVKGGHLPGPQAIDLLTNGTAVVQLRAPRHPNEHTHGTGCTLASALAGYLARGLAVPEAAQAAKDYVSAAIAAGFRLGSGIGPVWHGWAITTPPVGPAN